MSFALVVKRSRHVPRKAEKFVWKFALNAIHSLQASRSWSTQQDVSNDLTASTAKAKRASRVKKHLSPRSEVADIEFARRSCQYAEILGLEHEVVGRQPHCFSAESRRGGS